MAQNNQKPLNIALIGCGKMGGALLNGWLASNVENRVHVLEPHGIPEEFKDYSPNPVTFYRSAAELMAASPDVDVFVMAVKPQIMEQVCQEIAPAVPHDALILSIAAGQTVANFEQRFGNTQPIVRAMPNTPAAIHEGITGAVANSRVTDEQKSEADRLLRAVGKVRWVDSEAKMDAVTAISGSGPAYFFRFTEALAQAGIDQGLSPDEAMDLARTTFEGAAALSKSQTDTPLSTLRQNVTSPGGTTEAALNKFNENDGLQKIVTDAAAAAVKRGQELSL